MARLGLGFGEQFSPLSGMTRSIDVPQSYNTTAPTSKPVVARVGAQRGKRRRWRLRLAEDELETRQGVHDVDVTVVVDVRRVRVGERAAAKERRKRHERIPYVHLAVAVHIATLVPTAAGFWVTVATVFDSSALAFLAVGGVRGRRQSRSQVTAPRTRFRCRRLGWAKEDLESSPPRSNRSESSSTETTSLDVEVLLVSEVPALFLSTQSSSLRMLVVSKPACKDGFSSPLARRSAFSYRPTYRLLTQKRAGWVGSGPGARSCRSGVTDLHPFGCEVGSYSVHSSRFQLPPRHTQHADFPHYAFLTTSHRGLYGLSAWERFRCGTRRRTR